MPRVHRTALVSPTVAMADDVVIGPYAILEGAVTLGPGCEVGPQARIIGPVTLGMNNAVGHGTIIGERPQHHGYKGEETAITIGNNNIFREYCTVHKPMPGGTTSLGNHNLLMVGVHVAHDVNIGNHNTIANNVLLAGHSTLHDQITMSGHACLHQHVTLGRLVMFSGLSATSKDVPPFWIMQGLNAVAGVNIFGMRRAGMASAEIQAVRAVFRMIYLEKMLIPEAVERMTTEYAHSPAVQEVAQFIRNSKRGICGGLRYSSVAEAA